MCLIVLESARTERESRISQPRGPGHRSTKVRLSFASMARTKYSPAWAVMPFFESISTLRDLFSCKESANLMMPFWSSNSTDLNSSQGHQGTPPLAVRLLLSRFLRSRVLIRYSLEFGPRHKLRKVSFFRRASPVREVKQTFRHAQQAVVRPRSETCLPCPARARPCLSSRLLELPGCSPRTPTSADLATRLCLKSMRAFVGLQHHCQGHPVVIDETFPI